MDKMVIMKSWLEEAEVAMDPQDFNELCGQLVRYALFEDLEKTGNPTVDVAISLIIPQIDKMEENYNKKVEQGKKGGRPLTVNNVQIWKLAQEKNGTEIAEELKIPKSTLYSSEGWKQRKNPNYLE